MLAQAERLREDLGAYAGGLAGQVRVLSNTNALTEFLPETLSSFLAAHPNVSVDLEERLSDEIVGLIAEGVGDIGIVAGTVDASRLTTYPFRTDRFVLVVARDHPLAKLSKIDFAEVLDHDFVGLDRASAVQRFFADKAARVGRTLRLRVQLRSFDAVCRLVECEVGVGIVPATTRGAQRQDDGDQGGQPHRRLGAARADDLRPRFRGAAALCAAARRAHAGALNCIFSRIDLEFGARRLLRSPLPVRTGRGTHRRCGSISPRDQHPVIEIEDHRRIVFVAGLQREILARPVLGGDRAQPQRADVGRGPAVRSSPAPPTRRTPCSRRTAARRGGRR